MAKNRTALHQSGPLEVSANLNQNQHSQRQEWAIGQFSKILLLSPLKSKVQAYYLLNMKHALLLFDQGLHFTLHSSIRQYRDIFMIFLQGARVGSLALWKSPTSFPKPVLTAEQCRQLCPPCPPPAGARAKCSTSKHPLSAKAEQSPSKRRKTCRAYSQNCPEEMAIQITIHSVMKITGTVFQIIINIAKYLLENQSQYQGLVHREHQANLSVFLYQSLAGLIQLLHL